jgi:hypothetical protein
MSVRNYYICQFRLNQKDHFIIWFSDEQDGLLLDHNGKFLAWDTLSLAKAYAKKSGISICPEPVDVYDFDAISSWCSEPRISLIHCVHFLNVWNMFSDAASSIGENSIFAAVHKNLKSIYDKLFWGNNLPSLTPEGMSYEPEWSEIEADAIARLFRAGLNDLQRALPD